MLSKVSVLLWICLLQFQAWGIYSIFHFLIRKKKHYSSHIYILEAKGSTIAKYFHRRSTCSADSASNCYGKMGEIKLICPILALQSTYSEMESPPESPPISLLSVICPIGGGALTMGDCLYNRNLNILSKNQFLLQY